MPQDLFADILAGSSAPEGSEPSAKTGLFDDIIADPLGDFADIPDRSADNGISRPQTAAGQFVSGAGHVIGSAPKSVALGMFPHASAPRALDILNRIDRGEEITPAELDDFQARSPHYSALINLYRKQPQARPQIRSDFEEFAKQDPRKNPIYQAGDAIDEYMSTLVSSNPRYKEEFWAGKVPQGLGSTLGFALAGIGTGGYGAAILGASAGAVEGFEDAIDKGATLEQAMQSSGLNAAVGTTEALPIAHILDRLDKGTGGIVRRAIVNALKSGTEEAIQEASQQIIGNLIASDIVRYDPQRKWWQGSGENAGVGFSSGALIAFLGTIAAGRRSRGLQAESESADAQPLNADDVIGATPPTAEATAQDGPDISQEATPDLFGDIVSGVAAPAETTESPGVDQEIVATEEAAATVGDSLFSDILNPDVDVTAETDRATESVLSTSLPAESAGLAIDAAANEAATSLGTVASVPFMITKKMKAELRERGFADTDIANMTPEQAHANLAESSEQVAIDEAANEAATSPANNLSEPSEAQKSAGNYQKGHLSLHGLGISIENPAGSRRRPEWNPLQDHYGYIKGTVGKDKDHLDVFVGSNANDASRPVFVIDQIDPKTGKFDEHKIVLGAAGEQEAREIYARNYEPGWKGLGAIKEFTLPEFKLWLKAGNTKKPVALKGKAKVKSADEQRDQVSATSPALGADFGQPAGIPAGATAEKRQDERAARSDLTVVSPYSESGADRSTEGVRRAEQPEKFTAVSQGQRGVHGRGGDAEARVTEKTAEKPGLRVPGTDTPPKGGVSVSASKKPRLAESADDLWKAIKEKSKGVVADGGRLLYPTVRVVGGLDYQVKVDKDGGAKIEVVDQTGSVGTARGASPREAEELHKAIDTDTVQVLVMSRWGYSGDKQGRPRLLQELHSPSGMSFKSVDEFIGKTKPSEKPSAQKVRSDAGPIQEGRDERASREDQGREDLQRPAQERAAAGRPAQVAAKDPAVMTAAEINKELDRLDKEGSKISDELIASGRGSEGSSETMKKDDELSRRYRANVERRRALRGEIEQRYGPKAPSRLPTRGYGPRKKAEPEERRRDTETRTDEQAQPAELKRNKQASSDDVVAGAAKQLAEAAKALKEAADDIKGARAEKPREPATQKIEDFGEEIKGARKHYAAEYRDKMRTAMSADIAAEPLSKSWPEPDYQKLLEDGADPWTVAFVHAARDEIPTKPSKRWRLNGWVEKVRSLRDMASRILDGSIPKARLQSTLQNPEFANLRESLSGRMDLYQAVGHAQSLKGVRIVSGVHSMLDGQKLDPPKTIWSVEKEAARTAFSSWPQQISTGDTREQAIANFKKAIESGVTVSKPAEKQVSFIIYTYRGGGKAGMYYIGKKIGKNTVDLESFDDVKAARKYLAENKDKLIEKLERLKYIPSERKETNDPRVGVDHRNGADVTPEQFQETFGFRGVQFGNYVEGPRRQQDLNDAYDALLDMAGILNVPPKALSLNGELGLAFGARGHGAAGRGRGSPSAHYERDHVVINLTKNKGAGSLAHEWWHALDNYFSRMRGDKEAMLTERPYPRGEGMRPEMAAAFKRVMQTINDTGIKQRSRLLDSTRTKEYWSTSPEMSARAFESYIIEKLRDQGASNDYLANIVSEAYWNAAAALGLEKEGTYPYPEAAEIPAIRAAFDEFFRTVETEETDKGIALREGVVEYAANEDEPTYKNDLLGNPVPDRASGAGPTAKGRDVHSTVVIRLKTKDDAEGAFALETALITETRRSIPVERILTPADAALATAHLSDFADERFDAVVTDRRGRPLAVIGAFKGTIDGTAVYPKTLLFEAVRLKGAHNLWLSHNHPSGNSSLSRADEVLLDRLAETFDGSGIEVRGLFAIGSGRDAKREYTFKRPFDDMTQTGVVERKKGNVSVPVVARVIAKNERLAAPLESPATSMAVVPTIAADKPGIVLLDNRHAPVAFVPVKPEEAAPLLRTKGLQRIYRAMSRANAGAAIIANPNDAYSKEQYQNLANMLHAREVRPLDVVSYEWSGGAPISGVRSVSETSMDVHTGATFFSRDRRTLTGDDSTASAALEILGTLDDMYQLPTSGASDMGDIARAILGNNARVRELDRNEVRRSMQGTPSALRGWTISVDTGSDRLLDDYGSPVREQTATVIELPGNEIYLNISEFAEGGGGNAIYHAVANYAYNNGQRLIEDPYGLSDAALFRRAQNMLSSAVKFGTTRHLSPGERQMEGDRSIGVPPLKWQPGNDAYNVNALVETAFASVVRNVPDLANIQYNFDSRRFEDSNGRPVSEKRFVELAATRGARSARAGRNTLKRIAFLNSLVSAEDADARRRVLGAVLRQQGQQLDPALRGIFYKRNEARPSAGLSVSAIRSELAIPLARLSDTIPVDIVQSTEDLPFEAPADVKGAYHNGRVWLVADNLSPQEARRTLTHEVVGHLGLETMLGKRDFDSLLNEINLMKRSGNKAINAAAQHVYETHGKLDRATEAKEILAYLAENGIQNSLLRRVVAAIRQFLARMGLGDIQTAEIESLIARAARFVEGREAQATPAGQPAFQRANPASEAFKRWFGDSKVVDENGKPLVVYHGTSADFSEFGKQVDDDGYFFTVNPSHASRYAGSRKGSRVLPVHLSIKNPLRLTSEEWYENKKDGKPIGDQRDWIEAGHDGLYIEDLAQQGGRSDTWVAFYPEQIKSAIGNRGTFDPANPDITYAKNTPIFYSQLQRVLVDKLPNSGTGASMREAIEAYQRKGEIKQEELEWSGVIEWLSEQDGKVTKDQVLEFLRSNEIRIEEHIRGDEDSDAAQALKARGAAEEKVRTILRDMGYRHYYQGMVIDEMRDGRDLDQIIEDWLDADDAAPHRERLEALAKTIGDETRWLKESGHDGNAGAKDTRFDKWTLPGGQEYRELALTLPAPAWYYGGRRDMPRGAERTVFLTPTGHEMGGAADIDRVVHIRFNERTDADGKRVLFLEEIQSDWAQTGKREGFYGWRSPKDQARWDELNKITESRDFTDAEQSEYDSMRVGPEHGGVPAGPFVTKTDSWVSLAVKRMIRYAAENGFERVAWTTGEQQADRYDLSKQVDSVRVMTASDPNTFHVFVKRKGGNQFEELSDISAVERKKLPDIIGKDLAEKAVAAIESGTDPVEFSGVDLRVGGEGMAAFYDKMLPSIVNKYVKKWGAKVSATEIGTREGWEGQHGQAVWESVRAVGRERGQLSAVHSFDVTPEMRESALRGQPLFARAKPGRTMPSPDSVKQVFIEGRYVEGIFRGIFELAQIPKATKWLVQQIEKGVTEAKFKNVAEDGFLGHINRMLETARAGLLDRYGLSEEYKRLDRQRESNLRRVAMKGAEIVEGMKNAGLNAQEAEVLQAVLTGETVPDEKWSKLAEPIRKAIDELGAEAVELELISPETYERNRATYLHRVYRSHEAEQTGLGQFVAKIMSTRRKKIVGDALKHRGMKMEVSFERLPVVDMGATVAVLDTMRNGKASKREFFAADQAPAPGNRESRGIWKVIGVKGDKAVLWRDFTKEERRKMGEILDSRYTIAKTFHVMAHDLSTGRFLKEISQNPDWTWQEKGEPPGVVGNPGRRLATHTQYEWIRVPDTVIPGTSGRKRWGALAGKYVRAEIWRDLNELDQMHRSGVWDSLMTQWKLNKTARNPVVHMNNVMSNFALMDMADVRMRDLYRAIQAMRHQTQEYKDATTHGAFGGGFVMQEIQRKTLNPLLDEILNQARDDKGTFESKLGGLGRIIDILWKGVKRFDKGMLDLYQIEDEIFRMATYMRRLSLGDTPEVAGMVARDQFINYDIRAPWVNVARRTLLPFIAYTYRAVPLIAKTVAERPWKIAKYATIAYLANAMAYALAPGDEDEERRSMRDEQTGTTWLGVPRLLRMPWRDDYGNPVFLDIRRWIPAGDIFDTNQGQLPVPAPFQFGGPLMIATELALNRSAFTGKDIVNEKTADAGDYLSGVGAHLYRSWMPSAPWIYESWYWDKIERSLRGGRDPLGRPYSVKQALSSSIGIKLQPHDVKYGFAVHGREIEATLRELEAELNQIGRDRSRNLINEETAASQREDIREKLQNIEQKARKIFKGE